MSAGEQCADRIGSHGQEKVAAIYERRAARNPIALGGIAKVFGVCCDSVERVEFEVIALANGGRNAGIEGV